MKAFFLVLCVSSVAAVAQTPAPQDAGQTSLAAAYSKLCFETTHAACVDWFVKQKDFGIRRTISADEREQAQQLRKIWTVEGSDYSVTRMELVSLLKNDPPAVYVWLPHHVPANAMTAQIAKKSTERVRPLNEFETAALKKIKAGENVVLEGNEKAFGAIRAQASCMKCHDVDEGALLGAFSYVLEKRPPPMPSLK